MNKLLFLLILMPSVVNAEVVYLQCDIDKQHYEVTLDEANQTAIISDNWLLPGMQHKARAQFTNDSVMFRYIVPGVNMPMQYRIDRVTLKFEETLIKRNPKTNYGSCVIVEAKERKF